MYQVPNQSPNEAKNVFATIYIFDNRSGWASQRVSEHIEISDPFARYDDLSTIDNRTLLVSLGMIGPGESKTITITQTVRVDHVDLEIDPADVWGDIPAVLLEYTQPIPHLWESDHPAIRDKALELTADELNFYHKAKRIFDFVKEHLTYEPMGLEEHSALWAYQNLVGDCSEFTHLFIALARAAGIPANFAAGYGYDPSKGTDLEQMGHAFAFCYLPGVGWIPVDAVWSRPKGEFGTLSYGHLVLQTSDGKDLVRGTEIRTPGNKTSYSYVGVVNPDIRLEETAEIVREVAVEATLSAPYGMRDRTWNFYATVKNVGTRAIENIRVELQADGVYFEVPEAASLEGLGAGLNREITFEVKVKGSVENSPIQALVTYDCPYGSFLALSNQVLASPTIYELPPEVVSLIPMLLLAAMAGAVAAILIVLAKRR